MTPADRADCVDRCSYNITSAHEAWPPGHPAHDLIPGYLAREIAEEFISENATDEEKEAIIREAFTAAGHDGPVDAIVAMVVSDPTFLIPA